MLFEKETILKKHHEWMTGDSDLCQALGQLLSNDEPDVVLSAAGAVATSVESPSGLQQLLQEHVVFSQVLERVACLLNHERERVVNSATLILARLSLYEPACQKLLCHPSASMIFKRLVQCLTHSRTDTAMNASFTIGCLFGCEQSRCLILAEAKEQKLMSGLETLLSNGVESEAGQTACFALSCLASKDDGHALLIESPSLPGLLDSLLSLLRSGDPDSIWFAAMTVRAFVSRPNGVTQVREHGALEEKLKRLSVSPSTSSELQEELGACLRKLKRLPKPSPVTIRHQSMACVTSWEKIKPESGLEVTYCLFDGDTMLYRGPWCQITIPYSHIQHKQPLSLRLNLSTLDGDMSPFSEPVEIRVEGLGLKPGPPQDLCVTSCTATEVRLKWAGPDGDVKPRSFQVYCDDMLLETTRELGATVSSLSPSTTYTVSICTLGPGDACSSRCSITIRTADAQDHAPSGVAVAVLGCHKLQIIWAAPEVPLGRLFLYELRVNGCVVYSGRECIHTMRHLTANTSYTCTVTAITSRGRYQSQAVTKRTAKDEYVNTNRGLCSPKCQTFARCPARETSEVTNRGRKLLFMPTSDQIKSSRMKSEEKSVGLVAHLDAEAQLNNIRNSSNTRVVPSERHIMLAFRRSSASSSSHPVHPRPKINPVLQSCRAEKAALDKGRLPIINPRISKLSGLEVRTENVRLLQPVSYNWSDLNPTHHHQRTPHRKRFVIGSRANSRLKGKRFTVWKQVEDLII
ncbi:uncharacterized protein LOC124378736 isoform X2 [Silurus meridionalis]|uniref:uncharacterized protein LOC124378736 isoform X2 n=1 Tax=Silurus meridionalis TaxID=175797 RepID=UPI001EEB016F|nr:uncharacterized protein LOC124378736 isoform X2 [Silurus meridionalis]